MPDNNQKRPKGTDLFGDMNNNPEKANPPIPAATIILLRQREQKVEVLMLQKNAEITFGGMWVFPGGRIDDADYEGTEDVDLAARNAAVRETEEETGLKLNGDSFVHFSHWTPPASTPKRYATWFYAAKADSDESIKVDGEEILKHRWINPKEALELHEQKKIEIVPPTWVTLYHLSQRESVSAILEDLASNPVKEYVTRVVMNDTKEPVVVWYGDAAYETLDAGAEGDRHRLTLRKTGFSFENTIEKY